MCSFNARTYDTPCRVCCICDTATATALHAWPSCLPRILLGDSHVACWSSRSPVPQVTSTLQSCPLHRLWVRRLRQRGCDGPHSRWPARWTPGVPRPRRHAVPACCLRRSAGCCCCCCWALPSSSGRYTALSLPCCTQTTSRWMDHRSASEAVEAGKMFCCYHAEGCVWRVLTGEASSIRAAKPVQQAAGGQRTCARSVVLTTMPHLTSCRHYIRSRPACRRTRRQERSFVKTLMLVVDKHIYICLLKSVVLESVMTSVTTL